MAGEKPKNVPEPVVEEETNISTETAVETQAPEVKEKVVEAKVETEVKRVLPDRPLFIEIRPIEAKKWHGKTGSESFTRPKKLRALVDGTTSKYATGLTDKEIKALREEKKINYDLSDYYDSEKPHPFWDGSLPVIKLENNTMLFDISQPLNYIKYKIAIASRFVANSVAEYENGQFPDATHVIYDERQQAGVLASKIELKNQCIIEATKLSPERKTQLIQILGGKNVKGQSTDFVTLELDKVIQADPELFLRNLKMDAKEVAVHAMVLEALQRQVLRKEGHKILYMDSVLGTDAIDVVRYLSEDVNQDLKLTIMNQIN